MIGLVLLRLAIGWHFAYQGLVKLEDPQFSSAAFLSQAKGPLGDVYRWLLGDWDGHVKLAKENRGELVKRFDKYLKDFNDRYKLGPEQMATAEQLAAARQAQTQLFLDENEKEIDTYLHDLDRLAAGKESPSGAFQVAQKKDVAQKEAAPVRDPNPPLPKPSMTWSYPPFQQKRVWDEQTKRQAQLKGWSKELDGYFASFQQDLETLLDDDQRSRAANGHQVLSGPTSQIDQVDKIVSYGVTAIGVCLLAGLFTRLASFAGALFLLSIVLAQPDWPGLYPSPHPSVGHSLFVNKEFVMMMALFALATTRVGRWGGLDFFVHYCFVRPLFGRKEVAASRRG
ncbi:MAG TPA: DoxX family protein [Pirellulales bacterium]|nr:DoxX family protein [Pirellulales bacterium]